MFNSKIINIGAIALMMYCIYEFRTTNYPKAPDVKMYSGEQAKYSVDWDLDDSKPNKSITERVLGYVFSDKVNAIKRASAVGKARPVQSQYTAAIGDEVDVTYTITQDDDSSQEGNVDSFVLRKGDPLTQFVINMEPNRDKLVLLHKGMTIPKFIEIKGEKATMHITIKSLTKANN